VSIFPVNHPFVIGISKPDGWFDYVHQRLLTGAIPTAKWKEHIQECARICASGGWVEIIESTGQIIGGGPACQQFTTWMTEGLKMRSIDLNAVQNLDELMHEVGLINVKKHVFTMPFGSWGGKAGELFAESGRLGPSSIQPFVTSVFNVPKEEVERIGALMVEEFKSYQAYVNIYIYFGQKK
jgi:hypothetical protein